MTTKQPSSAAMRAANSIMQKCVPDRFQSAALQTDLAARIDVDFAPILESVKDSLRDAESGEKDRLPLIAKQLRAALENMK